MTRLFRSMKLLLGSLAMLAIATPAFAQAGSAVITGRLTSEQGEPLAGAGVQINALNISVPTNQNGVYTITVPAARITGASYTLRFRAIGYQPSTTTVTLRPGSQTVNATLKKDVTQLSAVVVTGVTGATEQVKMTERFTAASPDVVEWRVTFEDSNTWMRPWTFAMPLTKVDRTQQMFEYACHEGNLAMRNILSAQRAEEKAAAGAAK